MLYPHKASTDASPKAISGRTSYLRVRLAFHPYPQLIHVLFNALWFGPPRCVTTASPWPWIDHPVSGLQHHTIRPFKTRFRCGSVLLDLTLHSVVTRWPILQKVRRHTLNRAPTVCRHTVSGSFSLPFRGAFHLSLTVLSAIGRQVVFSLGRWSSLFPTGFHVSGGTRDLCLESSAFRLRGFHPLWPAFPGRFIYTDGFLLHDGSAIPSGRSLYPASATLAGLHTNGLGSSPFARRYLENLV